MTEKDDTVSVSAGGVEVVIGSKAVAQVLATTFSDTLSPMTELLGYIGDNIRLFRAENVAKAIHASQKRMAEAGIKFTPPEARFLIPYLEQVGTAYDDPDMREHWENLLVSASEGGSAEKSFYIDILSRMTAQDAKLLDSLCLKPVSGLGFANDLHDIPLERRNDSSAWIIKNHNNSEDYDDISSRLVQREDTCGSALISVRVWSNIERANVFLYSRNGENIKELESRIDRLKVLGLLQVNEHHKIMIHKHEVAIATAYLTHVGAGLFYATHDRNYRFISAKRKKGEWLDRKNKPRFEDNLTSQKVLAGIKASSELKDGIVQRHRK